LIVDDEQIKTEVLKDALEDAGYAVDLASSPLRAKELLGQHEYQVILTDIRMPGMDGLTFLRELKAKRPEQVVVMMTAYGTVEAAVEAMKLGAMDFLQKPFSSEELILKLDRLINYAGLVEENKALKQRLAALRPGPKLVGQSAAIRDVLAKIHTVAATDSTVLIEGESGTGKDVVARLIHESSLRSQGPLVAVSCASLPESLIEAELFGHEAGAFTGAAKQRKGRFELADGGTLFLDDIDDVPLAMQVKLLRTLQERYIERVGSAERTPVDIRLIAASKLDLRKLVQEKGFREDLYYRLNVIPMYLPPLRERPEDIPLLMAHFLAQFARRQGRETPSVEPAAMEVLRHHSWPGNVRELEHYVEQLTVLTRGDVIGVDNLPLLRPLTDAKGPVEVTLDHCSTIDLQAVLNDVEVRVLVWALGRTNGNLLRAAELLMVPRSTLQYRLARLEKAGYSFPQAR
jgi:DNA-binding NtrC family response regulator